MNNSHVAWLINTLKGCAFLAFVLSASPAGAGTLFEYVSTANDDGPGAGIHYTLLIDDSGAATFTISGQGDSATAWYAGWFTFKFVTGSTPSDIDDLVAPAGTGSWSIADNEENGTVKVLTGGGNYSNLLNASSTGFYLTSLTQGLVPDPTQGICLTSSLCDPDLPLSFTFNIMGLPADWDRDAISFQVGFYDGLNGNGTVIVNRLSRSLADVPQVPDGGASLALLGTVLAGLAVLQRRRRS